MSSKKQNPENMQIDNNKRGRSSNKSSNAFTSPTPKKPKAEPKIENPTNENTIIIQKMTPFGIKEIYTKEYIDGCIKATCELLDKKLI